MLDVASNDFYLMFDRKAFATINSAIAHLISPQKASIRYIGLQTINWGGYSQVEAVMTLLEKAVQANAVYCYLHFLQNADLPIKNNAGINKFFSEHDGTEFVNIDFTGTRWAERCCRYYYLLSHNRYYRKSRILKGLNLFLARMQEWMHICVNANVSFYYGSALFSITHPFATWLVGHKKEIRQRFRWALAPDEKFIQTMLMESPFAKNISFGNRKTSNAMLIDWTREREKNSPYVWRVKDFSSLISAPDEFCYARKFLERTDLEIVKMIEGYVHNLYVHHSNRENV